MLKDKILQDAVHGLIELEPIATMIIDTPEFQRLREIRQLGLCYLVFPSCTHTRFEHSIGVYHMARRLLQAIQNDHSYTGPRLSVGESEAVKIAALCHDLGHGPFSHLWENFVHLGGKKYHSYKHEKLSCAMLQRIVDTNPNISNTIEAKNIDLDLVKSLIIGEPVSPKVADSITHPYLYEILSNRENGMDVDKWDYLIRDSLHAGLGQGGTTIDVERLLRFYRPAPHPRRMAGLSECNEMIMEHQGEVGISNGLDSGYVEDGQHEWHLSFRDTEMDNVLRLFGLRQHLHQKLYQHKAVTAISRMVLDAFHFMDDSLNLRETSMEATRGNLDAFLQLHDSLIWDIYHQRIPVLVNLPVDQTCFLAARQLIERILRRQLYVYVDSVYELHHGNSIRASRRNSVNGRTNLTSNLRSIARCLETQAPFLSQTIPPNSRVLKCVFGNDPQSTADMILDGVSSKLSGERRVEIGKHLIVLRSTFTSNSTCESPEFYFYTNNEKTFVYEEPLRVVHVYRLYWSGSVTEKFNPKQTEMRTELAHAFNQWHRECIGDRYERNFV